ncbi:MAG: (2Fe-2S)-binding protein [Acidobacteriia bacterium]|nr:(2Fe-2S)-binding protein [Terriglobia bacterium]
MPDDESKQGVSRREFLKISAITVSVPAVIGPTVLEVGGEEIPVYGPGKTPITLTVNGRRYTADLEPRVTLLDALRDSFDLTGAKRVCDRAECGACTVLLDDRPVYACAVLAIDAQGRNISTVEGITSGDALHPVQHAFVANDAQQCGFCTPGFVMASYALLKHNPNPSPEQVAKGLGGNYCRCGTYYGMRGAIGQMTGQRSTVGLPQSEVLTDRETDRPTDQGGA